MFLDLTANRTLIGMVLLVAVPFLSTAQETHLDIKVSDRVENDLFGPVKKVVTEYSYNMSDRNYKEERVYDKQGNMLSHTKWGPKDEITLFVTNGYNETGCHTLYRVENVKKGVTNEYEVVINVPSRKIVLNNSTSGEIEIQEYSPAKYHMTTKYMDKNRKPVSYSQYKRRADHKELQYLSYDKRKRIKLSIAIDWNDDNLQSRELYHNRETGSKLLEVFEYLSTDQHGNWLQCLTQAYNLTGSKKEKAGEKFSKRTFEYFEKTSPENES